MVGRKHKIFPVEAIVRGYITGSAWKEYQEKGPGYGIQIPEGLRESRAFEKPIFSIYAEHEGGTGGVRWVEHFGAEHEKLMFRGKTSISIPIKVLIRYIWTLSSSGEGFGRRNVRETNRGACGGAVRCCRDRLPASQPKVFWRNGCCTSNCVIVRDQG
jgi:hypothetical protein